MLRKIRWMVLFLFTLLGLLPLAASAAAVEVQWLGQSAMKITTPGGKVIMIDPYLTQNPKTPPAYKNLAALGHIDLLLVTHAHQDHLGDAPALAKMNHAPLYAPAGLEDSLVALGIVPQELAPRMNKGGTIEPFPNVRITMIHADHSSELAWVNPKTGQKEIHVGGEPVGFIIQLENGFKIAHLGDTGLFGDMQLIGSYYQPDLLMLPIGGNYVMNPRDAAYATRHYFKSAKYAIPMHYGTNPLLKGTPAEYMQALGHSSTRVLPMKPGDVIKF